MTKGSKTRRSNELAAADSSRGMREHRMCVHRKEGKLQWLVQVLKAIRGRQTILGAAAAAVIIR